MLPASLAGDTDRLARFQREAEVLAALNHPNIAAIYGLERSSDMTALVMELVEGEDLSQRIARGAIPLDDALPIAKQIADALEAAHEQGIIHRDLKPANIKVRNDGTVKVLDFGLAKTFDNTVVANPQVTQSPTLTTPAMMTGVGMILGTAAYMSPEQARGKLVDKRADIWAFGVVLYEMLTARQLFAGATVTDVIAAVVTHEPDWSALPAATPPALRALLQRCLRKDAKTRLRDIGEAPITIDELISGRGVGAATLAPAALQPPRTWTIAAATAIATALFSFVIWRVSQPLDAPPPLVRATLPLSRPLFDETFTASATKVAFAGGTVGPESQLLVRDLSTADATPVAGVLGATAPFFSPDGQWIAFFSSGRDKYLRKVPVGGGPPTQLCEAARAEQGDWSGDRIVFTARTRGLFVVSADGGTPQQVLPADPTTYFLNPSWLPGQRAIVYTEVRRIGTGDMDLENAKVMALFLEPGAKPVKIVDGAYARFVPPHALVFIRDRTLVGVRFNPATLKTSGGVDTLQANVSTYVVSPTGTLLFPPSSSETGITFDWVDRQNHVEPAGLPTQPYRYPRISPDGTRIVVPSSANDRDLWVWDIRQKALTRLTTEKGTDSYPAWTPDGRRVIYGAEVAGGNQNLAIRAADGTGGPEMLLKSGDNVTPYTTTPDGEWLIFRHEVPGQGTNLDILNMQTREAKPLIATRFNERNAELSPDGRLLAYQSDETGRFEVYVRPFPNVDGGKKQISNSGGERPAWSRDGRRLFYETNSTPSATMNAADRKGGAGLEFGSPEVVFSMTPFAASTLNGRTYDVAADGRFLMPKRTGDTEAVPGLTLILNWASHLAANRQ